MWAINKSLSVLCSRSPKTWIFLGNAFWEILAVHLCQGFSVATPQLNYGFHTTVLAKIHVEDCKDLIESPESPALRWKEQNLSCCQLKNEKVERSQCAWRHREKVISDRTLLAMVTNGGGHKFLSSGRREWRQETTGSWTFGAFSVQCMDSCAQKFFYFLGICDSTGQQKVLFFMNSTIAESIILWNGLSWKPLIVLAPKMIC